MASKKIKIRMKASTGALEITEPGKERHLEGGQVHEVDPSLAATLVGDGRAQLADADEPVFDEKKFLAEREKAAKKGKKGDDEAE